MLPLRCFASLAAALACASAHAGDYLTPYAGAYNFGKGDKAAQFGVEYRYDPHWYGVMPTAGVNADTDGAVYGYAGLNWDVRLTDRFYLTPNFMAGAYHQGDSKDLGGAVEFRSGLEISYDVYQGQRLGLAFNHISNASIYDKNPGAETLLATYSIPIRGIFSGASR